jgi:hypothetical protein
MVAMIAVYKDFSDLGLRRTSKSSYLAVEPRLLGGLGRLARVELRVPFEARADSGGSHGGEQSVGKIGQEILGWLYGLRYRSYRSTLMKRNVRNSRTVHDCFSGCFRGTISTEDYGATPGTGPYNTAMIHYLICAK